MAALRIPSGPLRGVELETAITGNPRVQRVRLRFRALRRRYLVRSVAPAAEPQEG